MNQKTKSLIYFSCFVLASFFYYIMEQQDEFQEQFQSKTYVEADFQDADDLEEPLEDFNNLEEDQK
ncbi:hypothetical protein [Flagellimonas zhangzhouensis]|nr:hypothetical protein [Allomuricauda zhangzhouensis]